MFYNIKKNLQGKKKLLTFDADNLNNLFALETNTY